MLCCLFGMTDSAYFLVKILPGIKNTNVRRGPGVGGPTSANLSSLSLSLRRCCHDQPSLVGDFSYDFERTESEFRRDRLTGDKAMRSS